MILTSSQAARIIRRFPWPTGVRPPSSFSFTYQSGIGKHPPHFVCCMTRTRSLKGEDGLLVQVQDPVPERALRYAIDAWLRSHQLGPHTLAAATTAVQHLSN